MLCTEIVSEIQNIFVHNMFSPCSAKRRASDKDLPVHIQFNMKENTWNSELENWLSYRVSDLGWLGWLKILWFVLIWSNSWSVESFGKNTLLPTLLTCYVKSSPSLENSRFWIHLDLQLSAMILITFSQKSQNTDWLAIFFNPKYYKYGKLLKHFTF